MSATIHNLLLPPFLFGLFFSVASVLSYTLKRQFQLNYERKSALTEELSFDLKGQYYRLACLWEDIPQILLNGQSYRLACLWEDAPQTALKGQLYPLACLWEDIPQTLLNGQYYELAIPLTIDIEQFDESDPWWKILGVEPTAEELQVETAYKKLIRSWHPDLNKNPLATKMTSRLNLAYEQYQSINNGFSQKKQQTRKINRENLFRKLGKWINYRISQ